MVKTIVPLQHLRAVAASLVIIGHALSEISSRAPGTVDIQLSYFVGWIGVVVFFAVSGFILIRSAERGFGSIAEALHFACNRIVRIVPMYWLFSGVYVMAGVLKGKHIALSHVVKTFAFIPYVDDSGMVMRPFVGQGWTLNLEMFFYMIFALCLVLPRFIGLIALIASLPLLVALGCLARPLDPLSDPTTLVAFWTDPVILFFSIGVIWGLLSTRVGRRRIFRYPITITSVLFAGMVVVFAKQGSTFPLQVIPQALFGIPCILAVLACTMAIQVVPSWATKVATFLGNASFSTYLSHGFILRGVGARFIEASTSLMSIVLFIGVELVVMHIIGGAIHVAIEKPTTLFLKRHLRFTRTREVVVAERPS